jgi:hypothetical protein
MLRRFAPITAVLAVALGFTFASALAQEDLVKTLSTIEKSLWEGWKTHDAEPFRKHLAENAVAMGAWGIQVGKQKAIEELQAHPCEVESYSFSDWAAHRVSEDAAILTYRATQKGVCNGEKIPENVIVSATYVRENGTWLAASYHETPAEAM